MALKGFESQKLSNQSYTSLVASVAKGESWRNSTSVLQEFVSSLAGELQMNWRRIIAF